MTSRESLPVAVDHPAPAERRLSVMLAAIAADDGRRRITVADLLAEMGDRAFGALMFLFAVPNILPTPPGTSAVLGAPLVFLALQLTLGRHEPWLPGFITRRSLPAAELRALARRAVPWLGRVERVLRPRLTVLTRQPFDRVIGAVCLLLAMILFLPVPFGNMLPALAIAVLSLALLARDGIAVLAGHVLAAGALAVLAGVYYALFLSAVFLLRHAVGWL